VRAQLLAEAAQDCVELLILKLESGAVVPALVVEGVVVSVPQFTRAVHVLLTLVVGVVVV